MTASPHPPSRRNRRPHRWPAGLLVILVGIAAVDLRLAALTGLLPKPALNGHVRAMLGWTAAVTTMLYLVVAVMPNQSRYRWARRTLTAITLLVAIWPAWRLLVLLNQPV